MRFMINESPIAYIDVANDLASFQITLDCIPPAGNEYGFLPTSSDLIDFRTVSIEEFLATRQTIRDCLDFGTLYDGVRIWMYDDRNIQKINLTTVPNFHKKFRKLEDYLRAEYAGIQKLIDERFNNEIEYHIKQLQDKRLISEANYHRIKEFLLERFATIYPEDCENIEQQESIKIFHLQDLLSIITHKKLTDIKGLKSILHYMSGDPINEANMGQVSKIIEMCRPFLIEQHPQLANINADNVPKEDLFEWLEQQIELFGDYFPVKKIQRSNHPTYIEQNDFLMAIKEGDLTTLRSILNKQPYLITGNVPNDNELLRGCIMGDVNIVNQLLEAGANPDAIENNYSKMTALLFATLANQIDIIHLLMNYGATNIEANNDTVYSGITALMLAAQYGYNTAVITLLDRGANIDNVTNLLDGLTALHIAIKYHQYETMTILIERGASLAAVNSRGTTALMVAAQITDVRAINFLLNTQLNNNAKEHNINTTLRNVVIQAKDKSTENILNTIELLLNAGGNPFIRDTHKTAISVAKHYQNKKILNLLSQYNPLKNIFNKINFDTLSEEDRIEYSNCLCPLSLEMMSDPITITTVSINPKTQQNTSYTHTYDRKSLQDYFKAKNNPDSIKCPFNSGIISNNVLMQPTDLEIKNKIKLFIDKQQSAPILHSNSENTVEEKQNTNESNNTYRR